jgi:hypothetical protein
MAVWQSDIKAYASHTVAIYESCSTADIADLQAATAPRLGRDTPSPWSQKWNGLPN